MDNVLKFSKLEYSFNEERDLNKHSQNDMIVKENPNGFCRLPEILVNVSYSEKVKKNELYVVRSSHDAARIVARAFSPDCFDFAEEFVMLCLNQANKVIGFYRVSRGGVTGTVADPRIILSVAMRCMGTTSIIVAHNHPSGNIRPSMADEKLTEKLKNAAAYLDIKLLDHIIIGENQFDEYYSFADSGLI